MNEKRQHIVLGFNPDFTAEEVTRVAIEHAAAFKAQLDVAICVVGHQLDLEGGLASVPARKRLEALEGQCEDAGIQFEVHLVVREKTAGRDLVRFAEKVSAYELVVGFKERSTIGEIVFGSNYRQIIGEAPCPVVTVHVLG